MSEVDIFSNATPQEGEFFAFKKIGDAIQGTYIGKKDMMSTLYGMMQTIYILSDINGKIWNVAFNKERATITHERMSGIRLGQIVGFKFEDEKAPTKAGYKPTKIIRIYADPKYVNQAWLDQQKAIESQYAGTGVPSVTNPTMGINDLEDEEFEAPVGASPAAGSLSSGSPAKPRNEAIDAIRNLAKTKGLTNDSMSEAEADSTIEAYTKYALVEENLTKIIISLTGFSK